MKKLLLNHVFPALAIIAVIAACTGIANSPQATNPNPQVAVFAFEGAYETALTVAVAYARLPRCAPTVPAPCSTQGIVDQTVRARNVARDALASAKQAVRTPGFGADVGTTAVAAAQAAVNAMTAITNNLKVK